MQCANAYWGAPCIHGELLKLGIEISQSTVSRYMIRGRKPPPQTWRVFLGNHASEIAAIDFFTVPTATFRVLYVLLVLEHDRRHIVHFNVTAHPTDVWIAQLIEPFPFDTDPCYLLRDRDAKYTDRYRRRAHSLGIDEAVIARRPLWQNSYVEPVIGSIRRERVDHVIVLNKPHFAESCGHTCWTHLFLNKAPLIADR